MTTTKLSNISSNKSDCYWISLNKITDERGSLTSIENDLSFLPFLYKRVYFLYGMPPDVERGEHAHKQLEQGILAVSGSFDMIIDDGEKRLTYHLNDPSKILYVPQCVWREMKNFSDNCTVLVFASMKYDPEDYIRKYKDFLNYRKSSSQA